MSLTQSKGSAPVEVPAENARADGENIDLEVVRRSDITLKMLPYLDRHLIFPLLDFLSAKQIYPSGDMLQSKYDLLKDTNMIDYVGSLFQELHPDSEIATSFSERRRGVLKKLQELEAASQEVLRVLENPDVIAALRQDKAQNLQYLKDNHNVTSDMVDILYEFGHFQYNCGNYGSAADLLYHYRILSVDNDRIWSATWGKFACEILTGNWDGSMEELIKLKDAIETRTLTDPLTQLQQRAWLIHWSLYPFFNLENGREALCELFLSPPHINAIQTTCPWIIRYLAAALITRSGRSNSTHQRQIRELIRIIRQEEYGYSDAVTEFISALFIKFDFEEAQTKLAEAEEVLKNDFFLVAAAEDFMEAARHLISEAYCRIHQRIDIQDLSRRLNLSQPEGEKWIVNLIRETHLDAKIDFTTGTVLMNHPPQSIYQQVIEKTKSLSFRTQVLSQTLS